MSISAFIATLESEFNSRHNVLVPTVISETDDTATGGAVLTVKQLGNGVYLVHEAWESGDDVEPYGECVHYFPDVESANAYVRFRAADPCR